MLARTQKLKHQLRDLKQSGLNGQVALVGHSHYFTYLTCTEWNRNELGQEDFLLGPKKSIFLNNCEFLPFDDFLL